MADNFPKKILPAPKVVSPMPQIIDALDNSNSKYPPSRIEYQSWMPDFTRAVKLGDYIYRVNVPGYFWRHPKGSGSGPDISHKAGLAISRYTHDIDTNWHGLHIWRCCESPDEDPAAYENHTYESGGIDSGLISGGDAMPLVKEFNGCLTYGLKADYFEKDDGSMTKNKHVGYVDPAEPAPTSTIAGLSGTCFAAALPMQQYNAEGMKGTKRHTYFVCSGNSGGGCANNMIPIVPGMATTNTSYYAEVSTGGGWHTPGCTYCGAETSDTNSGSQSYSVSGAFFETVTVLTSVLRFFPKIGKDQGEDNDDYKQKARMDVSSTTSSGILEARGTYVFFTHESGYSDDIYFVPALGAPAASTIKPLTRIRACESKHVSLDVASNSSAEIYRGSSMTVPVFAYCCEHDKEGNVDWNTGWGTGGWPRQTDITAIGKFYPNSDSSKYELNHGHYIFGGNYHFFEQIWENQKLDGIAGKFVCQQYSGMTEIGTSMSASVTDFCGHVSLKAFDPATDGE